MQSSYLLVSYMSKHEEKLRKCCKNTSKENNQLNESRLVLSNINKTMGNKHPVWHWNSNKDPWDNTEKSQYTPYAEDINSKIEEAYQNNLKTIDIGDYYIDFKKMLQIHKKYPSRQRKVERIKMEQSQRLARYCDDLPNPRTINHPYGKSPDFLSFILDKIDDPHKSILQALEDLKMEAQKQEIQNIIDITKEAITLDAEKLASTQPDTKQVAQFLTGYLDTNANDLKSFYNTIIGIYTCQGYFYSRLNSLLRNEDWEGLKTLLPYLYCFITAFSHHDFKPEFSNSIWYEAKGFKTLTLYRGAPIDESALSFYDPKVHEYFAWNQIISASASSDVAKFFAANQANSAGKHNVLFEIRLFFPSNHHGVHVNKEIIETKGRTFFPGEEEYLLPPGSVFHLISREKTSNGYHIVLHVINNLGELECQGYQLTAKVNPQENTFHLFSLEGSKLLEKIQILQQEDHFTDLEISASRLSKTSMAELLNGVSKTSITTIVFRNTFLSEKVLHVFKQNIVFTQIKVLSLYITGMGLTKNKLMILKDLPNIQGLMMTGHWGQDPNDYDSEILSGIASLLPFTNLKMIVFIGFTVQIEIFEEILKNLPKSLAKIHTIACYFFGRPVFQNLFKSAAPEYSLKKFAFSNNEIPSLRAGQIFERIFTKAQIEDINFTFCYERNAQVDAELEALSEVPYLYHPISNLEMIIGKCDLTDKGLKSLAKFITQIPFVAKITLKFEKCNQITKAGIKDLVVGLGTLSNIKLLTVDFQECAKVDQETSQMFEKELVKIEKIEVTNDWNELTSIVAALSNFTNALSAFHPDEEVYSAKQMYFAKKFEI